MEKASNFIGQVVEVEMDRPLGTRHPKHNFMYPVNYGYVSGIVSGDGEELDTYVLGVFEPLNNYIGKCMAVIHRTNDDDDKLVVVPEGKNYTDEEIRTLTEFQERFFESKIIRQEDQIYNKLVRDNIPEIIKNNGEIPVTRILTDTEYKLELEKKLYEEYNEVLEVSGKDRIEELADMLEIISALSKLENSTLDEVIEISKEKVKKRGAFDKKIYLEKVITK